MTAVVMFVFLVFFVMFVFFMFMLPVLWAVTVPVILVIMMYAVITSRGSAAGSDRSQQAQYYGCDSSSKYGMWP